MSETKFLDSLTYGGKLFGYFLVIIFLSGSGLTLGGVFAGPELQTLFAGESPDILALTGGVLLASLGAALALVGTFGLTFKLVSDAVSSGVEDGVGTVEVDIADVTVPEAESTDTPTDNAAEESSPATGVSEVEISQSESKRTETDVPSPTEDATPQQREQSAEEIVFGTSTDTADSTSDEATDPSTAQAVGLDDLHVVEEKSHSIPSFEEVVEQPESPDTIQADEGTEPEDMGEDQSPVDEGSVVIETSQPVESPTADDESETEESKTENATADNTGWDDDPLAE